MKFIIEDGSFSYQVDWSKENKIVDDFLQEYHPSCIEALDAFMKLLTNIYAPEVIAKCIAKGLDVMEYAPKTDEGEQDDE